MTVGTNTPMDVTFFEEPAQLRAWLAEHHATEKELWIGFYKRGSGKKSTTYPQAVDEALCFGWIDSVRKTIDAESYANRFSPRKRGSIWSQINIKRVQELTELGTMQAPGRAAFDGRDESKTNLYSFEAPERRLNESYETPFRANSAAWAFWEAQPPSYRKGASWWVISAKREETRQRRLATLIEDSEHKRRIAAVTYTRKQ